MTEHVSCVCSKENCPNPPTMVLFMSRQGEAEHFHGCVDHDSELVEFSESMREKIPDIEIIITRSN